MSRKIEVNRLDKDELTYELLYRGIAPGTVDEMRARLTMARQLERTGESVSYPPYPFTFQTDAGEITRKLDILVNAVDNFSDSCRSGTFAKLQTKLNHTLGRIDNMNAQTPEELKVKSELLAHALSLLDSLQVKSSAHDKKNSPPPLNLCILNSTVAPNTGVQPQQFSSPPAPTITNPPLLSPIAVASSSAPTLGIKPILPHKWDIKFSGDKRGLSVTAFFERVEELRRARNVTKEILLESGIDIFTGRAYDFYLDCRSEVSTWDELIDKFKGEYQPAFYQEKLLEEIKRRTQGPDETIGTYLAIMSKYFQRLQCTVSEEAKLNILLRNIAPVYRTQLGALDITSIAQLRSLCKRIETRMQSDYNPPPRKNQSLEPDLAYIELEEHLDEIRLEEASSAGHSNRGGTGLRGGGNLREAGNGPNPRSGKEKEIICFRCKKAGHRAIGCAEPRKKYCYGCKKEGFTKNTCPTCKDKNPGNG